MNMQRNLFGKHKYTVATIVFSFLMIVPAFTQAQENTLKDSDLDGISDTAELTIYNTDINNPDTDNDGILDAQEVLDSTDPNDASSNALVEIRNSSVKLFDDSLPLMWFVGRISGISSFIMFTIVMCFGLLMTSKILLKVRVMMPPQALDVHMFTATFIAFILLLLHIVAFIFDDFIQLKIPEIFIPFLLKRDLVSALNLNLNFPIALGVISLYLVLILLVTSHLRNKLISSKLWRKTHYISFLFYITFLLHGILAGTDTKEPWMIGIYSISVIVVVSLVLLRIFGKKYFLPKPKVKPPVVTENNSVVTN